MSSKVIGARYYHLDNYGSSTDEPTPVDTDGHGTHTASTAAGIPVKDSSVYGIAKGTARGGSFHAMRKGILTSCAGGNDGPTLATVQNVAPWILTVGASSIDRQFTSTIKLGDGTITSGYGINTFSMKNKMYPFTNGAHATNLTGNDYGNISACDSGTLGKNKVKGKIVYCLGDSSQDHTIRMLDGAGTIVAIDEPSDNYLLTLIPATYVVRSKNGDKLDRYINSTRNPHAVIYKTRTVHMAAPFVASFSSRGPQLTNRNILKVKSIFSPLFAVYFPLLSLLTASNPRLSMASPTLPLQD
ncbi:hypothetical protein V6N12_030913 [Hibiscus sabdariffa]|uniref:Peptidase S8/S53 domain-containing protein n=1 Tax=Hibiscus sabdariffa TaxID=183260 RepID=A0ABR2E7G7_9ROSI